jgi:hypothetical protein
MRSKPHLRCNDPQRDAWAAYAPKIDRIEASMRAAAPLPG